MTFELETVDDLVAAGNVALARTDWEEARRCFESALARDESVAAWEGLSWATSWLGDTDASLAAREQAFRAEDVQRFLDALPDHDTSDRLPQIAAPTLVLAGGRDSTSRPELCRTVAELIPGACFEVLEEEAHQPFQEVRDEWNTRVDAFWREVEARH